MKGSKTRYSSSGLLKNAHTWRFAPSVALANRIGFSLSFGPADAKLEDSLVLTLSVVEVTTLLLICQGTPVLRACLTNAILFRSVISETSFRWKSSHGVTRPFLTALVIGSSKAILNRLRRTSQAV